MAIAVYRGLTDLGGTVSEADRVKLSSKSDDVLTADDDEMTSALPSAAAVVDTDVM